MPTFHRLHAIEEQGRGEDITAETTAPMVRPEDEPRSPGQPSGHVRSARPCQSRTAGVSGSGRECGGCIGLGSAESRFAVQSRQRDARRPAEAAGTVLQMLERPCRAGSVDGLAPAVLFYIPRKLGDTSTSRQCSKYSTRCRALGRPRELNERPLTIQFTPTRHVAAACPRRPGWPSLEGCHECPVCMSRRAQ